MPPGRQTDPVNYLLPAGVFAAALALTACDKDDDLAPAATTAEVNVDPANFQLAEALDGYYRVTSFEIDGFETMYGDDQQFSSVTWEFDYERDNGGTAKWISNVEDDGYSWTEVVAADYAIAADAETLTLRGTWKHESGSHVDEQPYLQEFDVTLTDDDYLKIVGTLDSDERVVIYADRE